MKLPENKRTAEFPLRFGGTSEIVLFSLSVEYMHRVEVGEIKDTPFEALKDASNFTEAQIFEGVRYDAAQALYDVILEITFGDKTETDEKSNAEEVGEGTEKK